MTDDFLVYKITTTKITTECVKVYSAYIYMWLLYEE